MNFNLEFDCTDERRNLTFVQPIKAVNNFDPEFSRSSYEIMIPTPLYRGIDITVFMVGLISQIFIHRIINEQVFQDSTISATDLDIKLFQLNFSLLGTDLFRVEGVPDSTLGGKTYTVKLITTQQISRFKEDIEFTLIATVLLLTFLLSLIGIIISLFSGFICRTKKLIS